MRKTAVVAILVVVLSFCGMVFAFQNEPRGFKKLYWGNSPTSTMEYFNDVDEFMKVYQDPSGENSIGSISFYRVFYAFYVDVDESLKFAGVTLLYNTEKNFDDLQTLCLSRFGPATEEGYQELLWEGGIGLVHLKYDSIEKRGFLSIDSAGLWDRYLKRKERKQVEDAEEDW